MRLFTILASIASVALVAFAFVFAGPVAAQGDGDIDLIPIDPVVATAVPVPTCAGVPATIVGAGVIVGGPGPDVIVGSAFADEIYGLGGDDLICGLAGDDLLYGGDGSDTVYGNDGDDAIFGGLGLDALFGMLGDDYLAGGPPAGEIACVGGPGVNTIVTC